MKKTPEYDKLDVYFNDDGGSGRFRGVSAGGSPQTGVIFKSWIEPIKDQHIVAVSGTEFRPTPSPGGTDSTSLLVDRPQRHRLPAGWPRVRHPHPSLQRRHLRPRPERRRHAGFHDRSMVHL